jgi:hypothetical protein
MGTETGRYRFEQGRRWGIITALGVAGLAVLLIPLVRLVSGAGWASEQMLAAYVLSGLILVAEGCIVALMQSPRTRYRTAERLCQEGGGWECVMLWDRPRWVFYTPLMALSVLFGLLLAVQETGLPPALLSPRTLGGVWVVTCFLLVLAEQTQVSTLAALVIGGLAVAVAVLLSLLGWAGPALRMLRYAAVQLPAAFYFMAAFVIAFVIFLRWLRGLFHYVAISPGAAHVQWGMAAGRRLTNDDYEVALGPPAVIERWLLRFGRVVVTLKDPGGQALVFFVPNAPSLYETIRRLRSGPPAPQQSATETPAAGWADTRQA